MGEVGGKKGKGKWCNYIIISENKKIKNIGKSCWFIFWEYIIVVVMGWINIVQFQ